MVEVTLSRKTILAPVAGLGSPLERLADRAFHAPAGSVIEIVRAYRVGGVIWYEARAKSGGETHAGYVIEAALAGQVDPSALEGVKVRG